LRPLHKTKNKRKKLHRTLFFKALAEQKKYGKERLLSILLHSAGAESHIFCKQKALHHANGTGQRNDFYFFSSFSQASAAPSKNSPP
jgi:hypothetical protein